MLRLVLVAGHVTNLQKSILETFDIYDSTTALPVEQPVFNYI